MLSHMGIMKNSAQKLAKRTWSKDGFRKCLAVASTSTKRRYQFSGRRFMTFALQQNLRFVLRSQEPSRWEKDINS